MVLLRFPTLISARVSTGIQAPNLNWSPTPLLHLSAPTRNPCLSFRVDIISIPQRLIARARVSIQAPFQISFTSAERKENQQIIIKNERRRGRNRPSWCPLSIFALQLQRLGRSPRAMSTTAYLLDSPTENGHSRCQLYYICTYSICFTSLK